MTYNKHIVMLLLKKKKKKERKILTFSGPFHKYQTHLDFSFRAGLTAD